MPGERRPYFFPSALWPKIFFINEVECVEVFGVKTLALIQKCI